MDINKRSLSYDIIRIVALMMIVMVHVSAYMVIFFPDTAKTEWLVGNLFNGIARAGVPMFVMLSGALLLKEDKPFDAKKFYKRNLVTMALLTVGWMIAYGLFYCIVPALIEGRTASISDFWGYLISFKGSDYPHLWYMLMVVGMYLMIPVLRLFVKRENKSYIIGIIIASLVFEFGAATFDFFTRDTAVTVSGFLGKIHMEPATGFIGMLLLGWYLSEFGLKKKTMIFLCISGVALASAGTVMVYYLIESVPNIRDYMFEALTLPAFTYGAALFAFIKFLCGEKMVKGKFLSTLSDSCFGIYLIHVAVMEIFVRLILPYEKYGLGNALSYIMILFLFTVLTSFVIVHLIGKVRGVRRIFFNR